MVLNRDAESGENFQGVREKDAAGTMPSKVFGRHRARSSLTLARLPIPLVPSRVCSHLGASEPTGAPRNAFNQGLSLYGGPSGAGGEASAAGTSMERLP